MSCIPCSRGRPFLVERDVLELVGEVRKGLKGVLAREGGVDVFGGDEVLDEVEGPACDEAAEESREEFALAGDGVFRRPGEASGGPRRLLWSVAMDPKRRRSAWASSMGLFVGLNFEPRCVWT